MRHQSRCDCLLLKLYHRSVWRHNGVLLCKLSEVVYNRVSFRRWLIGHCERETVRAGNIFHQKRLNSSLLLLRQKDRKRLHRLVRPNPIAPPAPSDYTFHKTTFRLRFCLELERLRYHCDSSPLAQCCFLSFAQDLFLSCQIMLLFIIPPTIF